MALNFRASFQRISRMNNSFLRHIASQKTEATPRNFPCRNSAAVFFAVFYNQTPRQSAQINDQNLMRIVDPWHFVMIAKPSGYYHMGILHNIIPLCQARKNSNARHIQTA